MKKSDLVLQDLSSKKESGLKYPFLASDLINLKLSEEEVNVLTARNLYRQTACDGRRAFGSTESLRQFILALLISCGPKALKANERIKTLPIDEEVVYDIVKERNLKEFDIQKLDRVDIRRIIEEQADCGLLNLMKKILERSKQENHPRTWMKGICQGLWWKNLTGSPRQKREHP